MCNCYSKIINSHRQTKNKPQIATSNIYIVPALPPFDNVSTTLLRRSTCQQTHTTIQFPKRVQDGATEGSHQSEFPRASQDHRIARYTEEMKFAPQLLLLADADHAPLVPVVAQFLQSVTRCDIGQLVHIRLGEDGTPPFFGSVHLSLAAVLFFPRPGEKRGRIQ